MCAMGIAVLCWLCCVGCDAAVAAVVWEQVIGVGVMAPMCASSRSHHRRTMPDRTCACPLTVRRKLFHILAVIMFVPGVIWEPRLVGQLPTVLAVHASPSVHVRARVCVCVCVCACAGLAFAAALCLFCTVELFRFDARLAVCVNSRFD